MMFACRSGSKYSAGRRGMPEWRSASKYSSGRPARPVWVEQVAEQRAPAPGRGADEVGPERRHQFTISTDSVKYTRLALLPAEERGREREVGPERLALGRAGVVVAGAQDRRRMDRRGHERRERAVERASALAREPERAPSSACAAVAPSSTSASGATTCSSARSHGRHALTSERLGFWWIRRFPRSSNLKCLTALVT